MSPVDPSVGAPLDRPRYTPRFPPRTAPVEVTLTVAAPRPVTASALAALSDDERERASRFRRPDDAARFVTARAIARGLLADRAGRSPAAVDLVVPDRGWKPRVPGTTLDVSIAHAGDVVVVAVADGVEIGVDVEAGASTALVLDEAAFSAVTSPAERRAADPVDWSARPREPAIVDAFLRRWTRKEAVLKAVRLGLAVPMDEVTLRDADPPAVLTLPADLPEPGGIALLDLDAPAGHRIALAAVTSGPVVVRDAGTGAVLARTADVGPGGVPAGAS